jgi:hypothetical protein
MRTVINLLTIIIALSMTVSMSESEAAEAQGIPPDLEKRLINLPLPENIAGKPPRFAYLRKLLEISSGAKQVFSSDDKSAHDAYIEARATYIEAAREADEKKVNELLNETVKLMYKAIRAASPKKLLDLKKVRDYKQKLLSVNALMEALERIAIEKKNEDETDKLKGNIDAIIKAADSLVEKGDVDKARAQLDEAYLLVKTGIDNMRNGDVLVRELKFATKQDEYSYELDRNDTHQMLVELLLNKKLADKPEAYKKKINDRVDMAIQIRKQSETLGSMGEFEAAIAELERSTKELVRAIRLGGIFIPG